MDVSFFDALLPAASGLRIQSVSVTPKAVTVVLTTTHSTARCPHCGRESGTVHARYRRQLQDRPCVGLPLHYTITGRKFRCPHKDCPRKIFCERIPNLATPHARSTAELADTHRAIGLALGGEAGSRLAARLAQPTSPDTILRRVKSSTHEPGPPPRYVGIDDWAIRKGQSYGTIVVDLERGRVIDLLPGRDGEALKRWLAANPQVEVVSRDRWAAYRDAVTTAAPQAQQVADRFHLLKNVREAVEKLLARHGAEIRTANGEIKDEPVDSESTSTGPAPDPLPVSDPNTPIPSPVVSSQKEQVRDAKREGRRERFGQVQELTAQGESERAIANRLGLSRKVIQRYRRLDRCPDWNPGRSLATQLEPFTKRIANWIEKGHRNSADMFRELKAEGYTGGYDAVRRYLSRQIGSSGRPGRRGQETRPPLRPLPSARKLSFRVVNPEPERRSSKVLNRLREKNPKLDEALKLTEELMAMLRQKSATTLSAWSTKAMASGSPDLKTLASSLQVDASAVQAAMTERWSNGPVEGQVGRLKAIKRSMYGRAGLSLLKARVLHKA